MSYGGITGHEKSITACIVDLHAKGGKWTVEMWIYLPEEYLQGLSSYVVQTLCK